MKTLLFLISILAVPFSAAHPEHASADPGREMSEATGIFLASLTADQKGRAIMEFRSKERQNWHFVPMNRRGIRLDELTPAQTHLAYALLSTGVSQKGFLSVASIMTLEQFLADEGGDPKVRDTGKYYLAIFGDPAVKAPWGWRFEGHHLSLNFTLVGGEIQTTPSFLGTNPAEIRNGPRKGLRPLGLLEDKARELARKLDHDGKAVVFTKVAPRDIVTGQDRRATQPKPTGIRGSEMTADQKKLLLGIIAELSSVSRPELANPPLEKIQAKADQLHFAWAGSLELGAPHYFRILSEGDFLIEYANTQNGANHAHAVWRRFQGDFGRDLLGEHLEVGH